MGEVEDFVKWVEERVRAWYEGNGVVSGVFGVGRKIKKPEWEIRGLEELMHDECTQDVLSCYGRDSLGVLLKRFLAGVLDLSVSDYVCGTLPGFDSVYLLLAEEKSKEFIKFAYRLADKILRNGDFEIRLKAVWKKGTSWGGVETVDLVGLRHDLN